MDKNNVHFSFCERVSGKVFYETIMNFYGLVVKNTPVFL